jgi:hypothetical protein
MEVSKTRTLQGSYVPKYQIARGKGEPLILWLANLANSLVLCNFPRNFQEQHADDEILGGANEDAVKMQIGEMP